MEQAALAARDREHLERLRCEEEDDNASEEEDDDQALVAESWMDERQATDMLNFSRDEDREHFEDVLWDHYLDMYSAWYSAPHNSLA